MTGGLYCCVYGCGNNQNQNRDKSFFSLPSDPEKLAVWLSLIRREELLETSKSGRLNQRVCCDHFSEKHFKFTKKLKPNAIPHLKLPVSIKKEPEPGPSTSKHCSLLNLQDNSTQTVKSEMKNSSNQTKFNELQCTSEAQTSISLTTNTPRKIKMELTDVKEEFKLLEKNEHPKAAEAPVTKDSSNQTKFNELQCTSEAQTPISLTTNTPRKIKMELTDVKEDPKAAEAPVTKDSSYQTKFNELQCTLEAQTPISLTTNTPRKIKMELTDVKEEFKLLEMNEHPKAAEAPVSKSTFLKLCDQYLDEKISNIIKCHTSLIDKFKEILDNASLDKTSTKKVIQKLEKKLGVDLTEKKKLIDQLVMDYVNSMESDDDDPVEEEPEKIVSKKTKKEDDDEDDEERDDSNDSDWGSGKKKKVEEKKKKSPPKPKKSEKTKKGGGGGGVTKRRKGSGYTKSCKLSPALAELMGESELPRHEVVKRVWAIIKEKQLFDPKNRQFAICDKALFKVIGEESFHTFSMMKYLKNHFLD